MPVITRRKFVHTSLLGLGSIYVTTILPGCGGLADKLLGEGAFDHGIASGDPLQDSVILWTRFTPAATAPDKTLIAWDIALDNNFEEIVASDVGKASIVNDFCVKVDVRGLEPDTHYYYRFRSKNSASSVGHTRTLPQTGGDKLKLAVLSCANHPAGYFHVYREVANTSELDLVLHLGDYIYEYGAAGYATENSASLGRVPQPSNDLLSLDDYRTRYAQYRSDPDLQAAHAAAPFLLVWDDHEVANDAWENGAENHSDDQGLYLDRKLAAAKAYFEWLPIRPVDADSHASLTYPSSIYRQFEWGDLANILMLDTRHEARDEPLSLESFFDTSTGSFDFQGLFTAVNNPEREMLGQAQRDWLSSAMTSSTATWQLLGQQVLMGRMYLPFAIASQQLSITEYAELGQLAVLAQRAQAGDPSLSAAELAFLTSNQHRLTPQVLQLLQAPNVPYNLDAWDGFSAERELVLNLAKENAANLVVVSGDTHNGWANQLSTANGEYVGVEFAGSSVSSPGLEHYLNIEPSAFPAVEAGIVSMVEGLKYLNTGDRGLLILDITPEQVTAHWHYVSSILDAEYGLLESRSHSMKVLANNQNMLEDV